jgi:predicted dienelactone hydrolase
MAIRLHAGPTAGQKLCTMLRQQIAFLALVLAVAHAVPGLARCPGDATTAAFLAPGPYAVGVRSLALVDTTRPTPSHAGFPVLPSRTLPTQVWYPATGPAGPAPVADAPLASGGPFPLVVNSHGFGDLNIGEAYLAIALARRGFVVASPTFPLTNTGTPGGPFLSDAANQPADVRFVIDQVLALSDGSGWLAGGVDRKRIGAQGLSLGGLTTLLVTYNPTLRDRRIRAAFAMAPASCELTRKALAPAPPLLLIDGDQDLITPVDQNAGRTFREARMPRTLVTLARATHTAFTGLITADFAVSYDAALGCAFVETITQQQVDDLIAAFGPAAAGTDTTGCDLPCKGAVPANAPLPASRQHDLTQAAGTAFFQERFQKSRAARCFLRKVLAAENPEVSIARRGGAAAP